MLKIILNRALRLIREIYFSIFPDREVLADLDSHPPYFTIETINVCNANCIFCAYQYQERPKQVMADAVFEKAVKDYVDMGGGDLGISVVVGDPLLDPHFIERVKYARSFPLIRHIGTTTNGLHIHKIGAERLLTSGLSSISISTTGFDPEMYARVFRSNRYPQMKQNVLDLLRTNQRLGKPLKISIALRIDKPLKEVLDLPDFEEVKNLADSVDANNYYDSWSGRIKTEHLTGTLKLRPEIFLPLKKLIPCSQLYAGIGVLVDGTVTACACRDLNGDSDLVLGNLKEKSLKEMWHSAYLKKLRADWFARKNLPNICRDCSIYNPYTYLMLGEVRSRLKLGRPVADKT